MPKKQLYLETKVAESNSEKDYKISSETNKLNVQVESVNVESGCPIKESIIEEYTSNSNINAEEAKSPKEMDRYEVSSEVNLYKFQKNNVSVQCFGNAEIKVSETESKKQIDNFNKGENNTLSYQSRYRLKELGICSMVI